MNLTKVAMAVLLVPFLEDSSVLGGLSQFTVHKVPPSTLVSLRSREVCKLDSPLSSFRFSGFTIEQELLIDPFKLFPFTGWHKVGLDPKVWLRVVEQGTPVPGSTLSSLLDLPAFFSLESRLLTDNFVELASLVPTLDRSGSGSIHSLEICGSLHRPLCLSRVRQESLDRHETLDLQESLDLRESLLESLDLTRSLLESLDWDRSNSALGSRDRFILCLSSSSSSVLAPERFRSRVISLSTTEIIRANKSL